MTWSASFRFVLAVALVVLSACSGKNTTPAGPPAAPVALHPDGTAFRDADGRQVMLRGVNFRKKGIFDVSQRYRPLPPFTADDCRRLADDFGMDFIRFPLNWSLLEPTPHKFDPAVIDEIKSLISDCHAAGIYTLVDLHQDGWSRFVGDDGAPLWAHAPPLPPADGSSGGGSNPFQPGINANYQAFYDRKDDLQKSYLDMLGRLMDALRGQPGVVGIEIMNEPTEFPDSGRLWAFYQRATKTIRAHWKEVPIFFEPDARRNIADAYTPEGKFFDSNAVYAPHIYTGLVASVNPWVVGDVARLDKSMSATRDEAKTYGAGLLIGEMGSSIDTRYGYQWSDAAFGVADKLGLSWSMWCYEEWGCDNNGGACWGLFDKVKNPDGSFGRGKLRPPGIVLFARPFPHAVPGSFSGFHFDPGTRVFSLQADGTEGDFELGAPRLVYPYDVKILCDGHAVSASRKGGAVEFRCAAHDVEMQPANEPANASVPYADALASVQGNYAWAPK